MIDLEKMFEKYDNSLIDYLGFETRINNVKTATFYDWYEFQKYINELYKSYDNYRWFITAGDHIIVFDFYNEEVKDD